MSGLKPRLYRNSLPVVNKLKKAEPNFVRMACTSASVSFRETLTEDELVRVLVTGKVPRNRRPHLRSLLEEAPENLVKGLIEQVATPAKAREVERNLGKVARALRAPKASR